MIGHLKGSLLKEETVTKPVMYLELNNNKKVRHYPGRALGNYSLKCL
jgi:hypothetical protein